jgi:hypothetical protein
MKLNLKRLFFLCFIFSIFLVEAQNNSISYFKTFSNEKELFNLYDSINKPLLIYQNKIFVIGSDCIQNSLIDGFFQNRQIGGKIDNRMSGGNVDNRMSGGIYGERNKNGKLDNRNRGGSIEQRNSGGYLSTGSYCEISDDGKVLIYTYKQFKSKYTKIFYNNKYFNNKYFKIINL